MRLNALCVQACRHIKMYTVERYVNANHTAAGGKLHLDLLIVLASILDLPTLQNHDILADMSNGTLEV